MTVASRLEQKLFEDLKQIAIPRHSQWDGLGFLFVRSLVKERLSQFGEVQEHYFGSKQTPGINYILKIPGKDADLDPVLIGAHYDGPAFSPGADDNASGLSALLELAAYWSVNPPRRPIWLVAFDQEEWGMVGSKALAKVLREKEQNLHFMVSLEMLGFTSPVQKYPNPKMREVFGSKGDYIALVVDSGLISSSQTILQDMSKSVKTHVLPVFDYGQSMPDVRLSDHSPFWDYGFNAMMITDTSFMRNPHYHLDSDTVETLDIPFLANVVEGIKVAFSSV